MRVSNMLALVLAFLVIFIAILLGGPLSQFLDIPSFLFVLLGPIFISLASFKPGEVARAFVAPFSQKKNNATTSAAILKALAEYSLAFGVIGILIGLINMLATMEDPKAIGCIMAVCVITVFYGLLLGQFIYLPLASHIEGRDSNQRR